MISAIFVDRQRTKNMAVDTLVSFVFHLAPHKIPKWFAAKQFSHPTNLTL